MSAESFGLRLNLGWRTTRPWAVEPSAWLMAWLALAIACSPAPRQESKIPDRVGGPRQGALRQRLLLSGELAAASSLPVLAPRTRAWDAAIRWMVADGVEVELGDTLVELDNSALAQRLAEARLAAGEAADELQRFDLEMRAQGLEKEHEVERKRVELEKAALQADIPEAILARREIEDRRLARRRAELGLAKAEEDLQTLRSTSAADLELKLLELERARRELEELEKGIDALVVRAPRGGVALIAEHPWEDRRLQVGDRAWPGMPLVLLPDLSTLQVESLLWDVDDGRLEVGDQGNCRLDAYPEEPVPCRVARISPVARPVDPESERRGFRVVIELSEADPEWMRPGMSVQAEIEIARLEGVALIGRSELSEFEGVLTTPSSHQGGVLGPCDAFNCALLAPETSGVDPGSAASAEGAVLGRQAPPRPTERQAGPVPDRAGVEAPTEAAIRDLIQRWETAWEAGDVDAYLACYADSFEPPGGSQRSRWRSQRVRRLRAPARIELRIDELEIDLRSPTRATARFIQSYASESYADRVRKELQLEREEQGWRISSETATAEPPLLRQGANEP